MTHVVIPRDAGAAGWRVARRLRDAARYPLGLCAVAGLYYGAAKVGFVLEVTGPVAGIIWLPVGVGIAFLYLGGLRLWPGVLAGDLLANDYGALPLGTTLAQTCGNVLEVLVATLLLRRLVTRASPLDSVRGVVSLLFAIAAGTAVSATIGTLAQVLGDVIALDAAPRVWRTWLLGDACGALVVVPLALAWHRPPGRAWLRGRQVEAALALLTVATMSELAMRGERPLAYLVFPALVWGALRFGQRGATLFLAVAVGFSVWSTAHYTGPFVYHSITHAVLSAQLFIAVAAVTTLCLAAVVSERERMAEHLRGSRARLVEASDVERRRLVRDLHDGAQQRLTALGAHLHLAAERPLAPADAASAFAGAERELARAVDELRELAQGLRPPMLSRHGLGPAIRMLVARAPVEVSLGELPERRLDDSAETTAYYVVAEGITNAQKHARASRVAISAASVRGTLHVEVADDGAGGATSGPGAGLEGLRDRVEAVGGTFTVTSPPGDGTRLLAVIPLDGG